MIRKKIMDYRIDGVHEERKIGDKKSYDNLI